jgi:PB1 domain/RWP-RK domain
VITFKLIRFLFVLNVSYDFILSFVDSVCPTTMKCICRHYGITRWPSRKINKVNRSLSKLKQVNELVQEQAGAHSSSGRDSINSRTTEGPCPVPEQSQPQLGRVLLEDSGSSKDLEDLCGEAPLHNLLTVTIKASYKEDIIRFRFVVPGSLVMLREDVSGRLKIEIGTFEIKYLDDDQQWVKLASDSDLEECMEIARVSSKYRIVRLLVSDIGVNLGSSCESTGGVNELNLYSNCKLYLCRVFVSLALHFG